MISQEYIEGLWTERVLQTLNSVINIVQEGRNCFDVRKCYSTERVNKLAVLDNRWEALTIKIRITNSSMVQSLSR